MAYGTLAATKTWSRSFSDYFALTKPRIVLLLLITAFAAMLVSTPETPPFSLLFWTLVGVFLSAGSANSLNCYIDRDIDAVMRRTMSRPLPAGRLSPRQALVFGITLGVASFLVLALAVNLLSAVVALSGILFYVFVYTLWLKRSTPWNIVIGGAAGSVPPLIGWAATTNRLELPAVLLFLIIFLWTPPHFWALALFRSGDYAKAKVPMLPVVRGIAETKRQIFLYTVWLVLISFALGVTPVGGPFYLSAAALLGAGFIYYAYLNQRDDSGKTAHKLFGYSIVYLGALFLALVIQAH